MYRTTDYCVACGHSPESGIHLFEHDYVPPDRVVSGVYCVMGYKIGAPWPMLICVCGSEEFALASAATAAGDGSGWNKITVEPYGVLGT